MKLRQTLAEILFKASETLGHNLDADVCNSTAYSIAELLPIEVLEVADELYQVIMKRKVRERSFAALTVIDFQDAWDARQARQVRQREAERERIAREIADELPTKAVKHIGELVKEHSRPLQLVGALPDTLRMLTERNKQADEQANAELMLIRMRMQRELQETGEIKSHDTNTQNTHAVSAVSAASVEHESDAT